MARRTPTAELPVGAVHLFATNVDVDSMNRQRLRDLRSPTNPVCRILATCVGNGADLPEGDQASGMQKTLRLAVNARVMLTRNLSVRHGLVNGSTGLVVAISYVSGSSPPDLPACAWVCFDGYSGPVPAGSPLGAVPIAPFCVSWTSGSETLSRTQLPLRLAWAVTIHKSQGLTLESVFVDLATRERQAGSLYTALSRVRRLQDLHVSGCNQDVLLSVNRSKGLNLRKVEQRRLRDLAGT